MMALWVDSCYDLYKTIMVLSFSLTFLSDVFKREVLSSLSLSNVYQQLWSWIHVVQYYFKMMYCNYLCCGAFVLKMQRGVAFFYVAFV